jgi:hypothetical protein
MISTPKRRIHQNKKKESKNQDLRFLLKIKISTRLVWTSLQSTTIAREGHKYPYICAWELSLYLPNFGLNQCWPFPNLGPCQFYKNRPSWSSLGEELPWKFARLSTCQSEPALTMHHEGWMVCDDEIVYSWVPVSYLTMVVSSVAFLNYLHINNPQAEC